MTLYNSCKYLFTSWVRSVMLIIINNTGVTLFLPIVRNWIQINTYISLNVTDTCSGSDQLKGGNAEEMRESWMYSGSGASMASVNSELVHTVANIISLVCEKYIELLSGKIYINCMHMCQYQTVCTQRESLNIVWSVLIINHTLLLPCKHVQRVKWSLCMLLVIVDTQYWMPCTCASNARAQKKCFSFTLKHLVMASSSAASPINVPFVWSIHAWTQLM